MVLYTLELGRAAGDGEDLRPCRLQASRQAQELGKKAVQLGEKKWDKPRRVVCRRGGIGTFLLLFIFRIANPNSQ
jgi:hypothetical protein